MTGSIHDRGRNIQNPIKHEQVGLPIRPFMFTIDQISVMIDVTDAEVKRHYVFFEGRSIGSRRRDLMVARNIAPATEKPEWRIMDREFIRWMKVKGFRYYERAAVSN